jgi:hypothetical protein
LKVGQRIPARHQFAKRIACFFYFVGWICFNGLLTKLSVEGVDGKKCE